MGCLLNGKFFLQSSSIDDADGYKSWLVLVIEELGMDAVTEVESEWMVDFGDVIG